MSRIITKKYSENPELRVEREKATFNKDELTLLIDQSEESTTERRKFQKIFTDDPNVPDVLELLNLSPSDLVQKLLEQAKYFYEKIKRLDLPNQAPGFTQYIHSLHIRPIIFPFESPVTLHHLMFIPTLLSQATEEQKKCWQPIISSSKFFGTYAQTELGHGSNIRDLEMTATYDPKSEEFVIHSPTMTAAKCWPGGLGMSSNYAVLAARLIVHGDDKGIHFFFVQLRSLDDNSPLPGITIGEIGPKMGLKGTDNGYLRFNNFRIPRENMLMKNAQILKDGTFLKAKSTHSGYRTMVFVRTAMLIYSSLLLGQCCTIAIRYNAIRRQGFIEPGQQEAKILDYQTQQYKLFPQVALAYAHFFSSQTLIIHFIESANDNTEDATEFHALSAGMKALTTHLCSSGIEICRQSCGGVGYLSASRFPDVYSGVLAGCTFEGDNEVLRLQTARYLVKSVKLSQSGQNIGKTVKYLAERKSYDKKRSKVADYLEVYEITTANMVKKVAKQLSTDVAQGKSQDIAWRDNAVFLSRCAVLHTQTYSMLCMHEFLCEKEMSDSLRVVVNDLFELLCLYWLQQNSREIIMYGGVSTDRIATYLLRIPILLEALRPNIVALVDAFDFCDLSLHSVIGCYDGRVYERLYEYWASLPTNKLQKKSIKSSL